MKVIIYQIVPELDEKHLMFRDLQTIVSKSDGKIPEEIYATVFEGNLNAQNLEDVFRTLNCAQPPEYHARSLSVSDIVEIIRSDEDRNFYFCDSFGFKPVSFDKSAVHKNQEE